MSETIRLIAESPLNTGATSLDLGFCQNILQVANDADPRELVLTGVDCIELHFPKFTDGRAYSQAYLLRRRLGFTGELRATGDVLVDQLQQLQRSGFSSAVLRDDQNLAAAQRQLARFTGFYQGDAIHPQPLFAHTAASGSTPATTTGAAA
ncbi:DUF934 domain-containing protein [Rhodoferax sp.]|uniref:DUF934 domain-containing protein n=1 Tax=Rhodoferax sp. TaxID=50421 RepID=UPI002850FE8D|nr:DUF934 domain-containing protein [Rhodoferax sp.]MDR3370113.1 DUF934 domain-containing protein [Rhodoferax sp.]